MSLRDKLVALEARLRFNAQQWPEDHAGWYNIDAADRIAAILAAHEDDGWQPIETAPRDGSEVLLFCGERHVTKSGKSLPKWYNLPPSPERSSIRSTTFQGIADAMADQWGGLLDK